jgi:hypothetical protein
MSNHSTLVESILVGSVVFIVRFILVSLSRLFTLYSLSFIFSALIAFLALLPHHLKFGSGVFIISLIILFAASLGFSQFVGGCG